MVPLPRRLAGPAALALAALVLACLSPAVTAAAGTAPTPTADRATNATVTGVTVWHGPGGLTDRLDTPRKVREATASGLLDRNRFVAADDTLVLAVRLPGLAERFRAATGDDTARLFRALDGGVWLERAAPLTTMEAPTVARLGPGRGTTVVADPANATYYLLVDPRNADLGTYEDLAGGDYEAMTVDWSLPWAS